MDHSPHELRLVVVREDLHLRQLDTSHEIIHFTVPSVFDLSSSIWIDILAAEVVGSPEFLIVGAIRRVIPFGKAEVRSCSSVQHMITFCAIMKLTSTELWLVLLGRIQQILDQVTLRA